MEPGRVTKRVVGVAIGLLAIGLLIRLGYQPEPAPRAAGPGSGAVPPGAAPAVEATVTARRLPRVEAPAVAAGGGSERERAPSPPGPDAEAAYWRAADVEDFKRAIYALEIESLERIHLLDSLVHTSVEDTRELWDTDWSGVDDWKDRQNGFHLERADDGTLLFVPGEETQRLFTFFESVNVYEYDEANDAFVNQVDYYGKPIFNVVKFLREDVLVMMTISGQKVDLSIYEQGELRP